VESRGVRKMGRKRRVNKSGAGECRIKRAEGKTNCESRNSRVKVIVRVRVNGIMNRLERLANWGVEENWNTHSRRGRLIAKVSSREGMVRSKERRRKFVSRDTNK
jgi:hypothetical protein